MLTENQIEERKKGLGGSDAAAALGVSKWKSPMQLWAEKLDLVASKESTEAMEIGNDIENFISFLYAKRTGNAVTPNQDTFYHPKYPELFCHVDMFAKGMMRGLEFKNVDKSRRNEYGEEGTDDIPFDVMAQIAHMKNVTGIKAWDVAVLFGGNEFKIYKPDPPDRVCEIVLKKELYFWEMVKKEQRPVATEKDIALLNKLYPKDRGLEIVSTEEILHKVSFVKALKDEIKYLERQRDKDIAVIKNFMDYHAVLKDSNDLTLATWKNDADSKVIDWQKVAYNIFEIYCGNLPDITPEDAGITANLWLDLKAKFTTPKTGARKFLTK